jgi:hypothetical protein
VVDFFAQMTLYALHSLTLVQPVEPMISLTAAHLVVGALTLAAIVVLTLRSGQTLVLRPALNIEAAAAKRLAPNPEKAAV